VVELGGEGRLRHQKVASSRQESKKPAQKGKGGVKSKASGSWKKGLGERRVTEESHLSWERRCLEKGARYELNLEKKTPAYGPMDGRWAKGKNGRIRNKKENSKGDS